MSWTDSDSDALSGDSLAGLSVIRLITSLVNLFRDSPDDYNRTNSQIERYHKMEREALEMKKEMDKKVADAQILVEKLQKQVEDAKDQANKVNQEEEEAKERILKREEESKQALEYAKIQLKSAEVKGDELLVGNLKKEVKTKEEEAKRLADEFKQAKFFFQRREREANDRVSETLKREAEARKATEEAQKREEQVQKELQQAKFFLHKGIEPEVWPTDEELQLAKNRIQYDTEKLHFAVCGSSGSGKSSLINAFRGLKNNSPQAAPTGVVETTKSITRYPDPRRELPHTRFVWFDCPGAGTLEVPGWQYFNQQGLFIFDIIVLVYDSVIISI